MALVPILQEILLPLQTLDVKLGMEPYAFNAQLHGASIMGLASNLTQTVKLTLDLTVLHAGKDMPYQTELVFSLLSIVLLQQTLVAVIGIGMLKFV